MAKQVLAIGALTLIDGPTGPLGGGVGSGCRAARAAGDRVFAASRIGLDAPGRELLTALRALGVDESTLQTDPDLPTGRRMRRSGGERIEDVCAFDLLQWDSDLESAARVADIVVTDLCARRHGQARSTIDRALLGARSAIRAIDLIARVPGAEQNFVREWVGTALESVELVIVDSIALRGLFPAIAEPRLAVERLRRAARGATVVAVLDGRVLAAGDGGVDEGPDSSPLDSTERALRVARALIDQTALMEAASGP